MEKKIRTLGTLFAKSFYVELDEVGRPSGSTGLRLAVRHPSAVSIVPVLPAGETLLVAQHRYPADRETLEFPAGKLNPGEDPEAAAFRETAEETGHRPGRVEKLLSYAPSLGYSDEIIHVFAAYDLTPVERPVEEEEISRVERVSFAEVKAMALSGRLIDGTTMLSLAAYEWKAKKF